MDPHGLPPRIKKSLEKKDVKYMGIPNICFSLTDPKDSREAEYRKMRVEQGFDPSETWSLFSTISGFIEPRLRYFAEQHGGHPPYFSPEEWEEILLKMADAFKYINERESCVDDRNKALIDEGLDLFRKYFFRLWN